MAEEDIDTIEDIFSKELERLQAAMDEVEEAPPEEPESVADAFAIGTVEPQMTPPGPPASDPLLAPPGPPSAPSMDALPPGPPESTTSQPAFAPPPGAFGAPPGPPPSAGGPPAAPPGPPSSPPGPPAAPPMDATPPGPPATPPGPPAAPPMDAAPPGPPAPPVDLLALSNEVQEDAIPEPPAAPPMDSLMPPSPPTSPDESPTAHFAPPEPIAPIEPTFDKVDIASWDSNWNEDWDDSADVYVKVDPKHVPEAVQDDVEWDAGSDEVPVTKDQVTLPSEAALKRMKKAELVELAKERKIASSGTKAAIIARLVA